jgi:hypothetical protein
MEQTHVQTQSQILNPVPQFLAKKHAHERDAYIQFEEEGHIYTIHGIRSSDKKGSYVSTTTFVHQNFAHFDADGIADAMVRKGRTKDPTHKYFGLDKAQILARWAETAKEASSQGTQMHYDVECYSNDEEEYNSEKNSENKSENKIPIPIKNLSTEFAQFLHFRLDFPHLRPYRTEWTVFYEEYKICGSIDMVYYNTETQSHEIYDWKRSKEIVFDDNFGKTALTKGLEHLPDTNYWHYSLQLNVYKRILEDKYGMQITGLYLICLHPDHADYERIEVRPMRREMDALLAKRIETLTIILNSDM